MEPKPELDGKDWQLLEALQLDARLGYAELGRKVRLSAPSVAERVKRLEEAGVISGYRATVNPITPSKASCGQSRRAGSGIRFNNISRAKHSEPIASRASATSPGVNEASA